MNHLGAGISLLIVVGECHRVKLPDRVVTLQDAARIFPGDRRAGLYLGPRYLGVFPQTLTPLGDKIVDPTLAVLVAGIPVLDRRVLDLRVIESDQLHHRGMQLIDVSHRRGASFKVTHVTPLIGNDQCALKLARFSGIDAKVSR